MFACPVVSTTSELYGAFDYESGDVVIDMGVVYGGQECQVNMNYVLFYITKQKLEFARFELSVRKMVNTDRTTIQNLYNKYIANYRDYFGKKSGIICDMIVKESFNHLFRTFNYAVDIISNMEELCGLCSVNSVCDCSTIPSMNISTDVSNTAEIIPEINKLITYANRVHINGIKVGEQIQPLTDLAFQLTDITFPRSDLNNDINHIEAAREFLTADMNIAETAIVVESIHSTGIKKLILVIELIQKIVDKM